MRAVQAARAARAQASSKKKLIHDKEFGSQAEWRAWGGDRVGEGGRSRLGSRWGQTRKDLGSRIEAFHTECRKEPGRIWSRWVRQSLPGTYAAPGSCKVRERREGRILDDLLSCYPGSDTALNLFRLAHFTDDENWSSEASDLSKVTGLLSDSTGIETQLGLANWQRGEKQSEK